MKSIPVTYYDGFISKPHQATLSAFDPENIMVSFVDGTQKTHRYHADQLSYVGAIGQRNPVIELDNDGRIEFHSRELPDWIPIDHKSFHAKVWKLERTPSLILFSIVFVLVLAFSVIKWGVPSAAKYLAFQLPENTLSRIGSQAETYINDYTQPSQLSQQQQDKIRADYLSVVAEGKPASLKFRLGDQLGANALALPNNTIILTDELVKLAHNDQEIIGVLAHEQAHLLKRHSLQQAISSLGFGVLFVALTGDSTDLITTLPVAIVGAGYSRKFETESDMYALQLMHQKNIAIGHFANFLERMNQDSAEEPNQTTAIMEIMASHPATIERVQRVRDFEAAHQVKP